MTQTPPKNTPQEASNSRSFNYRKLENTQASHTTSHQGNSVPDFKALESGLPLPPSQPPKSQPKASPELAQGRKLRILQRFYDLPINRKTQLIPLLTFVSLLGIVGLGAVNLFYSLRTQLLNQVKSQLAVTEIEYNIKIDQMGFGFRGQADNSAIIAAAQTYASGQPLNPALQSQVKRILQNEIKRRNIEYATLVGKDLGIIVNANANRTGETFNPDNLVNQVFKYPKQWKTSSIITRIELEKESPPLPRGFAYQDTLIRYTMTPVQNLKTAEVIGVLVSGDIVSGKLAIVQKTLESFESGYSAVYWRQPSGEFILATSLIKETHSQEEKLNLPLSDTSVLAEAAQAVGEIVTGRGQVDNKTYTLAAKALPNSAGKPVAILVYGDPEKTIFEIIKNSLLVQLFLSAVVLAVVVLLARLLGRAIAKPVSQLQRTTQEFYAGNSQARAEVFATDEVGQLASTFNEMADRIETNEELMRQEALQASLLAEIAGTRVRDQQALENVFNKAVEGARKILCTSRVVIYRFNSDGSGYISNESVEPGWTGALDDKIEDSCIPEQLLEAYRNNRVVATSNVFEAGFHPDHIKLMERLEIKANLAVPILSQGQLFGLLIAHHCSNTHEWQENEINFLRQLASQLQVTLERISFNKQRKTEAKRSGILKDISFKMAGALNTEAIFDIAVKESRGALQSDRVLIYRFDETWKGKVIAESLAGGWPEALGAEIADPCFADKYVNKYKQGQVQATPDIYNAGLTKCHLQQLEPFAVKANLVAPILVEGELLGLLIAHQCSAPRNWERGEIDFFAQLATQVGLALERVNLLEEQRSAKEQLQKRAMELLMEVNPVSQGNLTIRARVTNDEIGTIADSYNATIESLRKIVSQVQTAVEQVAATTSNSEASVGALSAEAVRQTQQILGALERIEAMTYLARTVAAKAEQAETAVLEAAQTVEVGDTAMNRTVEGILGIRETVAETAKKAKRLGESSQKISKVVNLISRFAAQTHLLALKASIEAARAGEEGQGFAVIADEVRSLAAQSAEATGEIETLVASIQLETKEVVASMEQGTEQVTEGTKLVDETRQSLNQIAAASAQINQLVEAIAQAAVEQAQTSETVTETMADVAAIAENTSKSATKVSASFKELLAVADQLQEDVAKFKVK
ncbi:MAG: methyl-accepting chemotaxis protein [Xenococcaceae cyanobacterium]